MEPRSSARFCLDCRYDLTGLPESRCPECGRRFDPADPTSYSDGVMFDWRKAISSLISPWWVLPAVWVLVFLPILEELVIPLIVAGFIACVAARRRLGAILVLACAPFTFFVGHGAVEYLAGTARLYGYGPANVARRNLDPQFRCDRVFHGCMPRIGPWGHEAIYDVTVETLIRTFGPMRGSYTGPYPTESEAIAAARFGDEISFEDLIADRVVLDDRTVKLAKGAGIRLSLETEWGLAIDDPYRRAELRGQAGPITAVIVQGACLVLRMPDPISDPEAALIACIDTQTGRPFAYYGEGPSADYEMLLQWSSHRHHRD